MTELDEFDRNRQRARDARYEAESLRALHKTATCGLGMKYTGIHYGNARVPDHIASRIAGEYLVWAAEYDAIAEEIEAGLQRSLNRTVVGEVL